MPLVKQAGLRRWAQADTAAFLYIAAWVIFYSLYIYRHSHFNNDDLDWLIELPKSHGLLAYMAMPVNEHFVPLCRLMIWVSYRLAPMNFGLVVVIILAFHIGTISYLWRTLSLTGQSCMARAIACIYASSVLPMFGMIWWANAMHRVPYVFLAICSIFHFLRWQRDAGRRDLVMSVTAFILAFGFYEKAVLIPAFMAIVTWLMFYDEPIANVLKRLAVPVCMLMLSCAYVFVYVLIMPAQTMFDLATSVRAELLYPVVMLAALAGSFSHLRSSPADFQLMGPVIAGGVWLFLLLAVLRRPLKMWLYALVIPAVVMLDFLPIAMSDRPVLVGPPLIFFYRYHFESVWLVCLMGGLCCAGVAASATKPRSRHPHVRTVLMLALYGIVNLFAFDQVTKHSDELALWNNAHGYMHALQKSLRGIPTEATFAESPLPGYLSLFRSITDSREIVALYRPDIHFGTSHDGAFRVDINGNVRPLHSGNVLLHKP